MPNDSGDKKSHGKSFTNFFRTEFFMGTQPPSNFGDWSTMPVIDCWLMQSNPNDCPSFNWLLFLFWLGRGKSSGSSHCQLEDLGVEQKWFLLHYYQQPTQLDQVDQLLFLHLHRITFFSCLFMCCFKEVLKRTLLKNMAGKLCTEKFFVG